jgi:hypothetical protein
MKLPRKIHPKGFKVNETWIAFRINSAPVRTEEDGDFNCFALMDAASCFILGMEMVPIHGTEAEKDLFMQLLEGAHSRANCMPHEILLAHGTGAEEMAPVAARLRVKTREVPETKLMIFIGEAKQSFSERFETTVQ